MVTYCIGSLRMLRFVHCRKPASQLSFPRVCPLRHAYALLSCLTHTATERVSIGSAAIVRAEQRDSHVKAPLRSTMPLTKPLFRFLPLPLSHSRNFALGSPIVFP
jgi:hypothetical protein